MEWMRKYGLSVKIQCVDDVRKIKKKGAKAAPFF
jgi:hypothetical protein